MHCSRFAQGPPGDVVLGGGANSYSFNPQEKCRVLPRPTNVTSNPLAKSPGAPQRSKNSSGFTLWRGSRKRAHARRSSAREIACAAGLGRRARLLAPPSLPARPARGACAKGAGRRAAGSDSRRLRRSAASLARTDAIIASPRQTPREFRSPHGNCSSRSRSRLHLPLPAGRERERDLPSSLLPSPSSGRGARARRPHPGRPARPANGPLPPSGSPFSAPGPRLPP